MLGGSSNGQSFMAPACPNTQNTLGQVDPSYLWDLGALHVFAKEVPIAVGFRSFPFDSLYKSAKHVPTATETSFARGLQERGAAP